MTGASSAAGRAVVAALDAAASAPKPRVARVAVVALGSLDAADAVDGPPPDLAGALGGHDVVVHVAAPVTLGLVPGLTPTARRARAVRAVQHVAAAAADGGTRRLVVVTSAMGYGARPDNPVPLPETAPLRAERDDGLVGDLLEVERIVERLPRIHRGLAVTVVRPAALVGPGVDTAVTRTFAGPRLPGLRGEPMTWQFCHVDDLGTAVVTVVAQDLDGPLAVGSVTWATDSDVERITGRRRVELPATLAYATARRLHAAGALATPPGELSYVVRPWVVRPERLPAAGWAPAHDVAACLALIEQGVREEAEPEPGPEPEPGAGRAGVRRRERRETAVGAVGAAGAAVALLGTAALIRRARARRGGGSRPTL